MPSLPNLDSAKFMGPAESRLKGIFAILSKLLRSIGLVTVFSCPTDGGESDEDGALPASELLLRARFMGLLGDVLVREEERIGLGRDADRNANFALGGNGTAKGEGVCGGLPENPAKRELWVDARFGGEAGEGDNGDCGEELGDFFGTKRNLDGDRDNERRRDLTAEVTST